MAASSVLLLLLAYPQITGAWVIPTSSLISSSSSRGATSNNLQQHVLAATTPQQSDDSTSADSDERATMAPANSRREWLTRTATSVVGAAALLAGSSAPATAAVSPTIVSTPNTCDVSVSVWRQPSTGRLVYILGTAHISSASADLAGLLVDDVRPDAVFVELDAKRVGMKAPKPTDNAGAPATLTTDASKEAPRLTLPPSQQQQSTTILQGPTNAATPSSAGRGGGGGMFVNPATAIGSAAVGGAIKGMYSKLGKSGFSPGEEFIVAVREGQKVGAKVILGDRDVDVTLKRVSEALRATDLRKLLSSDSELEQSLAQLMPSDKMPDDTSDEKFKSDLTAYVEVMKAKENVRIIMGQLQKAAPEIYNALVAERDAYMANGLNTLQMFPVIVAVMGIAHVDGVEQYLQREGGWEPVKLPSCSPVPTAN